MLAPQQAEPLSNRAQNSFRPACRLMGVLEPLKVTGCGVRTSFAELFPRPSWPSSFLPQHFTLWSLRRAQVAEWPVETLIVVKPEPTSTTVGTETFVDVFPRPSCPSSFAPQQTRSPLSSTAHEWALFDQPSAPESSTPKEVMVRPDPRSTCCGCSTRPLPYPKPN